MNQPNYPERFAEIVIGSGALVRHREEFCPVGIGPPWCCEVLDLVTFEDGSTWVRAVDCTIDDRFGHETFYSLRNEVQSFITAEVEG